MSNAVARRLVKVREGCLCFAVPKKSNRFDKGSAFWRRTGQRVFEPHSRGGRHLSGRASVRRPRRHARGGEGGEEKRKRRESVLIAVFKKGSVDPIRDLEIIAHELRLKDLQVEEEREEKRKAFLVSDL